MQRSRSIKDHATPQRAVVKRLAFGGAHGDATDREEARGRVDLVHHRAKEPVAPHAAYLFRRAAQADRLLCGGSSTQRARSWRRSPQRQAAPCGAAQPMRPVPTGTQSKHGRDAESRAVQVLKRTNRYACYVFTAVVIQCGTYAQASLNSSGKEQTLPTTKQTEPTPKTKRTPHTFAKSSHGYMAPPQSVAIPKVQSRA